MVDHIANRRRVITSLRKELVGPDPQGNELECSGDVTFAATADSYGPWRQKDTGEEILQRDPPVKRYGVGVLYPFQMPDVPAEEETIAAPAVVAGSNGSSPTSEIAETPEEGRYAADGPPVPDVEEIIERAGRRGGDRERDTEEFDLSTANAYKPSSMAVSFLVELPQKAELVVEASGGRYYSKTVQIEGRERTWWLRSPVAIEARLDADAIRAASNTVVVPRPGSINSSGTEGLDIRVEVFARPYGEGLHLLTVCLINRNKNTSSANTTALFQAHFKVTIIAEGERSCILPYPDQRVERTAAADAEEKSLALLYRKSETYATGHGCAADWQVDGESRRARWVSAECLPEFETPTITSDVVKDDGTPVVVSMAALAGLVPGNDGFEDLAAVIRAYEDWIEEKSREVASLDASFREAAGRHIEDCRACARRMRAGLEYLRGDADALRAFRLANHAILLQQVRSGSGLRRASYNSRARRFEFSRPARDFDLLNPPRGRGQWRAFQIAFLLMTVHSTATGDDDDRRRVELIWFPTGGGKTEAYLGLAAYATFMRRLKNPQDVGVNTLMRYTLRLLTAQQFQRASGLLCAMEYLRRQDVSRLGEEEFSIGIWVGGSTSSNWREDAIYSLTRLLRGDRRAENPFILTRCPWCGAQLGVIEFEGKKPRNVPGVLGYEQQGDTVIFRCPDNACEFNDSLPIYVIDEDIYEKRPSLVIGTVDKFAMLAWRPQARSLFGIDEDGERVASPPGLIIQDELHLISGPLGSMVGLYEAVIEELCTDRRGETPVPPKIVSSTATIRRYAEQINALYARDQVTLFPPPGLEAGDSFFARYSKNPDGSLRPGRIYVGVHAPGLGSLQTVQVRTFSALLQAPVPFTDEERDPWWTLLLFFNSLRELGTTVSLFQSDIPDYFRVLLNRTSLTPAQIRDFRYIKELTGRLRSEEVPEAIAALEVRTTDLGTRPVDVCLASNIIEVGVDIDRLSLMAVVGQPKTTSQYIQVTGRVGRLPQERPGLVVTIYGASKPRDRSHFEKFRSYHERLYAQVEPTSVTPFSPRVLDRALHAIMAAYAVQEGDQELVSRPYPYPEDMVNELRRILMPRVRQVDAAEVPNFERVFDRRAREWRNWQRTKWYGKWNDEDIPLIRAAGTYASRERANLSWATPMSMRNVDAECQIEITRLYIIGAEDESDD
ncbi:MAG TPA: helicase-related protein [Pyrinomonadaceae bacterium]